MLPLFYVKVVSQSRSAGRAYRYQGYAMETRTSTKSSGSYRTIATRDFTVTGTTLT